VSDVQAALVDACAQAGLNAAGAELIRAGENTLFRLPGHVVARVTRPGQLDVAAKEVRVSRWLKQVGVNVVNALPQISQPVEAHQRAITFWDELPPHREGSIDQVADVLRRIHHLQPPPALGLPNLQPFVRLETRILEAQAFNADDRVWLVEHLRQLTQQYSDLPTGLPPSAVHGDAWGGNIVSVLDDPTPIVLDLERFAYGAPEWDLTSIAVDHFTFGTMSAQEWNQFCGRYGHDVTEWAGYSVLRGARELRKVTFAGQMATQYPQLQAQARYRLACIRGLAGPRPWHWTPVP
jgi:aminoglycoside phosphotransferase (APT) family kinase protein